ncbi:MAG: dTMP kinase [Candidatus Micrarchaeota archaeon]|nr:dTMP kinase [Candidatus Micrarchaeota archaeon]
MARGTFIVLEGLDGAGVSAHAASLESHLRQRGYKTLLTKEPTTGAIGSMIKEVLKKSGAAPFKSIQLLFCADRAKHLEDDILPALEQGRVVVCDRYMFSTLAYGFASGVDTHWLYNVNREFQMPDLTIFIDINPDLSISRIAKEKRSREIFEKRETLGKVRKAYLNLAKRFRFRIVSGEQEKEAVDTEIAETVDKFLTRR